MTDCGLGGRIVTTLMDGERSMVVAAMPIWPDSIARMSPGHAHVIRLPSDDDSLSGWW